MKLTLVLCVIYALPLFGKAKKVDPNVLCEQELRVLPTDQPEMVELKHQALQLCFKSKAEAQQVKIRKEMEKKIKSDPYLKKAEKKLLQEEKERQKKFKREVKAKANRISMEARFVHNANIWGPAGADVQSIRVNVKAVGGYNRWISPASIQVVITNEHYGPIDIFMNGGDWMVKNLCSGCRVTLSRSLPGYGPMAANFSYTARGIFPDGSMGEADSDSYSLWWDTNIDNQLQTKTWRVSLHKINLSK